MSSPVKIYQSEMYRNIGFFANWLPGDPIAIGAVGVLVDGRFRQESSLQELKIPCKESDPGFPQDLHYTSKSGVKIASSTSASIAAAAKAEVSIEFSDEGAFIFQATDLTARQLGDRTVVTRKVLEAYDNDQWRTEWVLVESLHISECATIIVSEGRTASLVLAAQVDGPISPSSLADPKLGLHVASSSGRLVQIICGKKLRPLYRCARLSGGWIPGSKRRLTARGNGLAPLKIADLLNS